ncbi:hypothetical protein SPRG_09589 [Saprolegnia parasitica CBS 223.65]|uniref:Steroid 5-alpha reductase C-terminal domain-containing protein n=1 Tax=Saprolegnia parasitica (strain CBS 223.65) TaxID=695850 RepID=A0A067C701_SAPPC|nr:hypothetical protein SPRG_09589 [Saprolegnia parasitica CBS 223.65]KDO24945.1 hypothetical protein SPRG_09589 [Saprolegnia parasitica CBS 223.65]|eukprot:XP_012204405.1 hypothetical protein SPRG_09589 [Saprolegnia parasitica CBS 223.65]
MEWIYVTAIIPVKDYCMYSCLGGPRPLTLGQLVNLHKAATVPLMVGLMHAYDNFTISAYIYVACHGSLGVAWLLKSRLMPDRLFAGRMTIMSSLLCIGVFGGYWAAGFLLISGRVESSSLVLSLVIFLHTMGLLCLMCTDTQKFYQLKARPGLITDGWLTWSRNTNYLGTFSVYLAHAILAQHWFPYAWLGLMVGVSYLSSMIAKDISLRKKDGADRYMSQAGFFFPNLFGWARHTLYAPIVVHPDAPSGPSPDEVVACKPLGPT